MSLFPKVLWPFSYLTLPQNKPSEFFECYLLFDSYCLTMIDEIYLYALYSYAIKPNKSPLRNRLLALLLWEIGHLSSPNRSCLDRLILICGGRASLQVELPHILDALSNQPQLHSILMSIHERWTTKFQDFCPSQRIPSFWRSVGGWSIQLLSMPLTVSAVGFIIMRWAAISILE